MVVDCNKRRDGKQYTLDEQRANKIFSLPIFFIYFCLEQK